MTLSTTIHGDPSPEVLSEDQRVLCWRLALLGRTGYTDEATAVLAMRRDVDLHQAIDLLRRSCSPEAALRILL